jgi:hypothetical protein
MNKRLLLKIEKQNAVNKYRYKKDDSKRIIIGTLRPNCDKSLK